ncbi:hypothetical protein [Oryza sativa Japonica Group]|uniref:Uncharacterized protein n=1 Tax=Oryza sativa subsp. japonica TaxID=39947 RepID=Q5QLU0_ORYSJ|nr:hypothetical protein [Oryza sativa Japonica Group]BAD81848.1 hypothetical protein [Oryza sativa Japonica Group]
MAAVAVETTAVAVGTRMAAAKECNAVAMGRKKGRRGRMTWIDRLPEVGGGRTWTGYKKGKLGMGRLVTVGCSEGGSEVRRDWLRRRQGRRKGIGKRQIIRSGTCTVSMKID